MRRASEAAASAETDQDLRLGRCRKGWRGSVSGLVAIEESGIPWNELERRLLEMGFVEGAAVEILHEGPIKHDPIAVRVDETTVAVRRADALAITVRAPGVN
ncbi:ferrous iron transport protein A [Telmatospirillum siberiense]|uniref:Ferrous iron transport protein A n=1 Tax=Telmatospirillum siberiense TaxID=382514 RepID=A0A2N3PV30_9PROT|nr:ferrous iron transport protein A [Telmatospirillum siberiense]